MDIRFYTNDATLDECMDFDIFKGIIILKILHFGQHFKFKTQCYWRFKIETQSTG
jgi:hypothetical protein